MELKFNKAIDRPVDQVFTTFTDLENAADRVRGIQKLELVTDGPVGNGTVFRETRVMMKRECTEEMTITEFEPNKSYTVSAHTCGNEYTTKFEFEPTGSGTRVDVTFTSTPQTVLAKLMSPIGWLMSGTMRKLFDKDLEDLKAHAESNAARSADSSPSQG